MKAQARARKAPAPIVDPTSHTQGQSANDQTLQTHTERARKPGTAAKPRRARRVPERDMDVSLTVGIPGADVDGGTFDLLEEGLLRPLEPDVRPENEDYDLDMQKEKIEDNDVEMENVDEQNNPNPEADDYDDDNFPVVDLEAFAQPGKDIEQMQCDLLLVGYAVRRTINIPALPEPPPPPYIPLSRGNERESLQEGQNLLAAVWSKVDEKGL
ncbi:hypothetical protein R1sor_000055 [Riccia sorocarpa]|uniref:Uncharacterized protein n=1 Tax=Riccia sorocarpa TaxID=122646 RepID=A0ABD3GS93_9MARC